LTNGHRYGKIDTDVAAGSARGFEVRVTVTEGKAPKHDGFLESEDDLDVVKIPSAVLNRTFQTGLWDQVNVECGTDIDDYEGVWLDSSNLVKAASVIRRHLNAESAPHDYVECLLRAAEMLEKCANRHVRVMFSF
jgi:hypothetical protein